MSRILIAGCGYVGSELARRLLRCGHAVWGLGRRAQGLPPGVVPIVADLAAPASLAALPTDLDAVVYAASADGRSAAAYRAAYVEGPRNLLDVLSRRAGAPRRLLYTSSTSVYGQSGGEWVDEASPTEPATETGRILLDAERLITGAPIPSIVLRLGGIYGPGRAGLAERVREGLARYPPHPPLYSNRIHRDDAAGMLQHLLDLESPERLYLGVDTAPTPIQEIVAWLAARAGLPAPQPATDGEHDAEASRLMRSNKRCRCRRIERSGYLFRFPTFREGFAGLP